MASTGVVHRSVVSDVDDIPVLDSEPKGVSSSIDEKIHYKDKLDLEAASTSEDSSDDGEIVHDARDLVTHVISVEDDPSLNPWTFRSFFIGLGLSTFGGVLGA